MKDDESYRPPRPAKATKLEVRAKDEEAEPIFATHKRNRSGKLPSETRSGQLPGSASSPPNMPPDDPPPLPTSTAIYELEELADLVDALPDESASDETPRRDPSESMRQWRAPPSSPAPTKKEEHFRHHWADNMRPSCFFSRGHSDFRQLYRKSNPDVSAEKKARPVSVGPHLSFDSTPSSSPIGSPMRCSVYGIATPSTQGSLMLRRRGSKSDGERSAPPSKPTKPRTSPDTSHRPVDSANTR